MLKLKKNNQITNSRITLFKLRMLSMNHAGKAILNDFLQLSSPLKSNK